MKHLLLIAIAFMLIGTSCTSKQSKAEALVKAALQAKLNDPKSYESVSFSSLEKLTDTVFVNDGKSEKVTYDGQYEIEHTYRAKNALGGVITTSDIFHIDSAFTKADGGYIGQHVHKTIN